MLLPLIQISQEYCNELTIKDITPAYSPKYPGGYGSINIDANLITQTRVTISFGKGQDYQYVTPYNQTKEDIIISSIDFFKKPEQESSCSNCGFVDHIETDSSNRMMAFPSGCLDIMYQVYSDDSSSADGKKLEGTKVIKFVSTCDQDKKLIELMDKITIPNADGYYNMLPEKRKAIMENFTLTWQKMKLLETSDGCDCDCIAARIKQIEAYLNSVVL